jgi:cell division protein DivIC
LKNKYIMVTLAFIVWVGFFDRNDMITQWHLRSSLRDLRHKKQYYIQQVAQTELESHELLSSPEKLQKFAREKYLMKKDNEDLFVVEDSSQAPPK